VANNIYAFLFLGCVQRDAQQGATGGNQFLTFSWTNNICYLDSATPLAETTGYYNCGVSDSNYPLPCTSYWALANNTYYSTAGTFNAANSSWTTKDVSTTITWNLGSGTPACTSEVSHNYFNAAASPCPSEDVGSQQTDPGFVNAAAFNFNFSGAPPTGFTDCTSGPLCWKSAGLLTPGLGTLVPTVPDTFPIQTAVTF